MINREELLEFVDRNRMEALGDFDEQIHEYVDEDEIEEYGGDPFEAYLELGRGEAEADVSKDYAQRYIEENDLNVDEQNFWDIQEAISEALFDA